MTRIAIVGMGMAGLRTAMLLEKHGVDLQLYEARLRPGGRVHTVKEGDAVYDAGGEWIDADHRRCLNLLDELQIDPIRTEPWPRRVIYDSHVCSEATLWSDAMEDELRVEASARELCRDLDPIPWNNAHRTDLDQRTLADFLRSTCESERGLWWVTARNRSDEGEDPERISLLGWLLGFVHYLDREGDVMSAYRAPGGMGSATAEMAKRIATSIQYGAILRRVNQTEDGVHLIFDHEETVVDRAIITLPPPALERVVFEPPLSTPKRCAVEACGMSRTIKICWEFENPWWEQLECRGSIHTDGPLQQLWAAQESEAPVLCAYIGGEEAVEWINTPAAVRIGYEELCKICPEAKGEFVRGWMHDWVSDPFSLGAFSHMSPGYVIEHMRHIFEPVGRVHFAGEHTSSWTGFMEGALESAERVTSEVLDA